MGTASWRPEMAVQLAFNASPNDPAAVPVWTDATAMFRAANDVSRGRQYELDQNQASQPAIAFFDINEYLNPANTGGPFAGSVVPYRQLLWQYQWPNGGTGNLLNTGVGACPNMGTTSAGVDPTFDSYTVGNTVPWITAIGSVSATVSNTTPQQGANDLTWNVVNGATVQGVSWVVPCIPGRAYITSAYVRQTSASTQQITVVGQVAGTSTTTTGAYVRLTAAFVATQPFHTVQVVTSGTAVAGTVRLDALMHEQTAALNATPRFVTGGGVGGWTATGASIAVTDSTASTAFACLRITPDGVTGSPQVNSEEFAATAAAVYTLYGRLMSAQDASIVLEINWYNSSHVLLSASTITTSCSAGVWTQFGSTQFTAPANTAFARVATVQSGTPTVPWYLDVAVMCPTAPSTFTSTGPVIYGVVRDSVERWPARWDHAGFLGLAEVTAVDGFAGLNLLGLSVEYVNKVLSLAPAYFWQMGEGSGVTVFAETSGNNGPPLTRLDSVYGPAPVWATGTQMSIPGAPGATGLSVNTGVVPINDPASVAQTGVTSSTPPIALGGNAPTAWTAAWWMSHTTQTINGWALSAGNVNNGAWTLQVFGNTGSPNILVFAALGPGTSGFVKAQATVTDSWADGVPHLYVVTATVSATTVTVTAYVDGAQVATASNAGVTGYTTPWTINWVQIGGFLYPSTAGASTGPGTALTGGVYCMLGLWTRALSGTEITGLWTAGRGYPGETSGARIARYLSYGWNGPTSIDTGQSVMGTSDLAAGTATLAACQSVTATENGNFWIDKFGNTTFAARTRRYLETTSQWTFGERSDLGEYPYEGDIVFDFDPTLVYNVVEIDNADGFTAIASDTASKLAYYPRGYQRNINVQNDNEAIDAADYLLGQHKDPHLRVEQITLDPTSNPDLWAVIGLLEIGQRVTVKRRASSANNGAGITIAQDFFVENISHTQVDMQACTWLVVLYLSPVDIYQVGIIFDSTYGRLGSDGAQLHTAITASATSATVDSTGGGCVFTTTGTPFSATVGAEIVAVTAVTDSNRANFATTVANGWGTATIGGAWTTSGGSASDYSCGSGVAKHTITSVNVSRETILGSVTNWSYGEGTVPIAVSAIATGAEISGSWEWRRQSASNTYRFEIGFGTNSRVQARIVKVVAGVATTLVTSGDLFTYTASGVVFMRWQALGSLLQMRIWTGSTAVEPFGQWTVTTTDTTFTTGGMGCRSIANTGNTNTTPFVQFSALEVVNPQTFTITRPTDGTAVAHSAGAPVQTNMPFVLAY